MTRYFNNKLFQHINNIIEIKYHMNLHTKYLLTSELIRSIRKCDCYFYN